MTQGAAFHCPRGGGGFLGFRRTRAGEVQIVYDDGVRRRMVFRVATPRIDEARLGEALRVALAHTRVVPALYSELKKRAIAIECVG